MIEQFWGQTQKEELHTHTFKGRSQTSNSLCCVPLQYLAHLTHRIRQISMLLFQTAQTLLHIIQSDIHSRYGYVDLIDGTGYLIDRTVYLVDCIRVVDVVVGAVVCATAL